VGIIGTVKSDPEILTTKNGKTKAVFLTVQFSDDSDVRSVQYMAGAGNDDCPVIGDIVCAEYFGGILVATAVKSKGDPVAKPGERHITARDKDGDAAKIDMLPDGTVNIAAKDEATVDLLPDGTINIAAKKAAKIDLLPAGTVNAETQAGARLQAQSTGMIFAGNKQADIRGLFDDIFTGLAKFATALIADPYAAGAVTALQTSIPQWQTKAALFLSGSAE
jgi:hypothetical protein